MPSIHDEDDTEQGPSGTDASTEEDLPPPGPEVIDDGDGDGPDPPAAYSTNAAADEKPAAKTGTGTPGPEVCNDAVEPRSSSTAVPSKKMAAPQRDVGASGLGLSHEDTEPLTTSALASSAAAFLKRDASPSAASPVSEDMERRGSENNPLSIEIRAAAPEISAARESSVNGSPNPSIARASDRAERGDSAIRIPEAWAVTDGNDDAEEGGEGEVFIATPVAPSVPWWKRKQSRLYTWVLLWLFSAIALAAFMTDETRKNAHSYEYGHPNRVEVDAGPSGFAFITACSAISLSLSALASVAYVRNSTMSRYFVGKKLEGVVSFIIVVLWSGALPIIVHAANYLAMMYIYRIEDYDAGVADWAATIRNFNLYFSSWGSLICALVILAMYIGERRRTPESTGMGYIVRWCLLMLVSLVVVIESKRFKEQVCSIEGGTRDSTCVKNTLSFIAGIIGLVLSFSMSMLSYRGRDSAFVTAIAGLIMAINYIFCAGTATFGDAPAEYIGNYSLGAWAGVFMSLSVFAGALKEYMEIRGREEVSQDAVNDNEAVP